MGLMILLGASRVSFAVAEEKKPVYDVITVSAAITPPIATHILQSIEEAEKSGAWILPCGTSPRASSIHRCR
jgi:hypothetical protein